MRTGPLKPAPRMMASGLGIYGNVINPRFNVWTFAGFRNERWWACWASIESPRHDRHHTPYDPRLVVGCETARPGPIARFLMSRVRSAA